MTNEAIGNSETHRENWVTALTTLVAAAPNTDDASWWRHERKALIEFLDAVDEMRVENDLLQKLVAELEEQKRLIQAQGRGFRYD